MFSVVQLIDRNQPGGQNAPHLHAVPTRDRNELSCQTSDNSDLLFLHYFYCSTKQRGDLSCDHHGEFTETCSHDNICFRCKHINHLLLVYSGSVDLSFLNVNGCTGLPRTVIIEDHLPHQHHQLMQILPQLQHKVSRVAGHWHKHIHILTRLKRGIGE